MITKTGATLAGIGAMTLGAIIARSFRIRKHRRRLNQMIALVTGGSRGLGFILARKLLEQGAQVTICARDASELEAAVQALGKISPLIEGQLCDVSDSQQAHRMIRESIWNHGTLDLLINNAGVIQAGPAEMMTEEELRKIMEINFWGTVHCTTAALPSMKERKSGRIINITSIGGVIAVPHLLTYSSSKFATVGYSLGLATELRGSGVQVTTIAPGLMRTGSFIHALLKGHREKEGNLFALSDSLPFISMDAEKAADRILDHGLLGTPFAVIGGPFKAARLFSAVFPGLMVRLLSGVNRLILPSSTSALGKQQLEPLRDHRGIFARPPFTLLSDRAGDRFNEKSAFKEKRSA